MTKSKLTQLLGTFSKTEFNSFGKFVRSPYFYKDKAVVKLYNSLKTFYPQFDNDGLTKQNLFRKMFIDKKYSDSHMKYLMSELFRMAKVFLSYQNYGNDLFEQNNRMLKELNIRNAEKIFESELKRIENQLRHVHLRDKGYFYHMFKMKELVNEFYSYKNRLSIKREQSKIIENIINYFLVSLLDYYYEMISDALDFKVNIDLTLFNFIEEYVNKYNDTLNPAVLIYYNIFMISYRKEPFYYKKLLELRREHLHILDGHGKHRIFEALLNYCIIRYQQGGIEYYKNAFELINDEINNGVRFNRKNFSEIFFTNKVEIASKVKEFKWAEDFIGKYKDKLNKDHREDIINFSYAILEFEKNNYRASIERLSKINLHHPLLKFRIRNYSLLNYYELSNYEQAFLMLDAYRHLLEKDKTLERNRIERYSLFLHYYQKLLEIKSGSFASDIELIKRDIEAKSVFMRGWLLEKTRELHSTE